MLQLWVTGIKEKFIQECEAAADQRQFSCSMVLPRHPQLLDRGVGPDLVQQQLQGMLTELGFKDATVTFYGDCGGTMRAGPLTMQPPAARSGAPKPQAAPA